MTSKSANKQLQYTYCPISQEVKTNRQRNLVQLIEYNRRYIFLLKSYTKSVGETVPGVTVN